MSSNDSTNYQNEKKSVWFSKKFSECCCFTYIYIAWEEN